MAARMIRVLDSRGMERAVQVAAAVALTLSVYVGVQQVRLTQCLADYNNAAAKATVARYAAAEQDRAAQDAMFRTVAADPRKGVEAIRAYTEQRRQADEQRRKNPLPEPPEQRC